MQIGKLLDGVHRVVHAARPQDVHELVDFLAQAGGKKIGAVALAQLDDTIDLGFGNAHSSAIGACKTGGNIGRAGLTQASKLVAFSEASQRRNPPKREELAALEEAVIAAGQEVGERLRDPRSPVERSRSAISARCNAN